jgi:hypothetical protein
MPRESIDAVPFPTRGVPGGWRDIFDAAAQDAERDATEAQRE